MINATVDRPKTDSRAEVKQENRGKGYLPQHDVNNRRPHGDAQNQVEAYLAEQGEATQLQIMKLLGYSHVTSASNVLRKMIKNGKVKMRTLDGLNRYYPASRLFADEKPAKVRRVAKHKVEEVAVPVENEVQAPARIKQWVRFIKDNPGSTAADVVRGFKLEGSYISTTVASALHNEVALGHLKQEERDGETVFFARGYKAIMPVIEPEQTQVEVAEAPVNKISEGHAIDKITEIMETLQASTDGKAAARVLKYVSERFND